jgi:hypothetical protein
MVYHGQGCLRYSPPSHAKACRKMKSRVAPELTGVYDQKNIESHALVRYLIKPIESIKLEAEPLREVLDVQEVLDVPVVQVVLVAV